MNPPVTPPQILPQQLFAFPQAIQNLYFNGFSLQLSNSDVSALLLVDGRPVARLNMSFTTTKTLNKQLTELIGNLEKVTGHVIMVTEDVEAGLKKLVEDQG